MNKQMLQKTDELFPSEATLQKEEAKRQALIAKQYEGKGYAGGVFGPSGMYRSVARDFLLDQNAKGIIKLDSGVVKALEDRAYISGGQPLMYPDPIRVMRFHYGDDVFEKIPLDKIKTGAKSEILDTMSKVEANPVKIESPITPGGYMTPGEIKANIDELKGIERMIKRRESRFADMTDEQIQNELEQYGSKRSSFEMALQSDYPEEAKGLDYLTGQEPPKNGYAGGGRIGFEKGSIPEEEDEEPSEEYIKSREAGRFKYSFDVQGPDSRTRKSGLPGRTNPKDYGLGITYLSNSGNETAPEIRVGGSRRGVGIEIRKRFKEGGLGYLVGE
jgi:hypothetical protein